MAKYDVCLVGSGAGSSPVAYELSKAGYNVIILEKGPWIKTKDFSKDELLSKKDVYIPNLKDEYHELISKNKDGEWQSKSTKKTNSEFWNGSAVGGSSNFMSGYFHRLKPVDFKLLSTYGPIEGANIADWPITYEELEPYYSKVEHLVGVSGNVSQHKYLEPRSEPQFPYPALQTNIVSQLLDKSGIENNISVFETPRAILTKAKEDRNPCYYSNFCGSYGCSSDAKGSGRAALLNQALKTDKLTIIPHAKVYHLETDGNGKVIFANYYDKEGVAQKIEADIFVIGAQATETSRLLLMSKNKDFPNGLANNSNQVGKNILFSGGGIGSCIINYDDFDSETAEKLKQPGLFVNRATQEWYEIEDEEFGPKAKGGTVDFLWENQSNVGRTYKAKWDGDRLTYGSELKTRVKDYFTKQRKLNFEIFADWLPNDNCKVELSEDYVDKWGDPVGKIWIQNHKHDEKVGDFIGENTIKLVKGIGGTNIKWGTSSYPSVNLQAGGCRFGTDPKASVLDKNCKAHDVDNLYITDGSFMPTGGSVTYTFTIYANAFRVADKIIERLKK
jgi:choline dehydrogenase-like flavoprotein